LSQFSLSHKKNSRHEEVKRETEEEPLLLFFEEESLAPDEPEVDSFLQEEEERGILHFLDRLEEVVKTFPFR
jgi:hypothetical protein